MLRPRKHSINSPQSSDSWTSITSARIMILGCGGVGSVVAEQLVAMGFKNFILVDGDKTEPSNLNRQTIFTKADIGRLKVQNLKSHLLERNPNLQIKAFNRWIKSVEDILDISSDSPSLVVSAIDSPPVLCQQIVCDYSLKTGVPCVFAGLGIEFGSWGPFLYEKQNMISYKEYLIKNSRGIHISEESIVKASLCATNHLISSWLCLDIFNYFSKCGPVHSEGRKVSLSFDLLKFSYSEFGYATKQLSTGN